MEGVIWACEDYDSETPGGYVFTPSLPAGYAVEETAALPEFTVTVQEEAQAATANAAAQMPESITPIGLSLVIMVLSFFPGSTAPDSMFIIT